MTKAHGNQNLQKRRATAPLLAVSLAASLAAFGCTTNHNVGNGAPARSGPEVRTAPTSGVTSGSEREAAVVPPPMTSASAAALPGPTASLTAEQPASRADRAAAILAGDQPAQGRYLGVTSPGAATHGYVSDGRAAGQMVPPAPGTNSQQTVNSSIASDATAAASNSVAQGNANNSVNSVNANASANGTGLATTATGTVGGTGTVLPGSFAAAGSGLTTAASVVNPTVTTASGSTPTPTATTGTTVTPTAVAGGVTSPAVATAGVPSVTAASGANGVRIVQGPNGATITNVGPSTTTTTAKPATGSNKPNGSN